MGGCHGLVGHGSTSVSQCRSDAEPEADDSGRDTHGDTDQDAGGRGSGTVVEDESDDHAADDGCDQEPTEACEITSPQGVLSALIVHPAGSLSRRLRVRGSDLPNLVDTPRLATPVPDPDRAKLSQRSGAPERAIIRTIAPEHRVLEVGVVVIGGLVGSSSCGGLVKNSTKS
jgi:hypothetical protein